ncbi:MAG: hypothetical protein WAX80_00880 [Minisyncoccia bacterium]
MEFSLLLVYWTQSKGRELTWAIPIQDPEIVEWKLVVQVYHLHGKPEFFGFFGCYAR